VTCQLAALFTREAGAAWRHGGIIAVFGVARLLQKEGIAVTPLFFGATMYPEPQPPLPLSHHHYATMALPPAPPRPAPALALAEARLRNILMGV